MLVCAVVTVLLGCWRRRSSMLNASFEKMIPQSQPYIQNYLDNRSDLRGLGNALRVVVENTEGDIFDPKYLETLKQDQRRALPHAGRRPRLGEVAVDAGGALDRGHRGRLPRRPGDARHLRRLAASDRAAAQNIARSGIVGSLVANDFKSSMIFVPLLDKDPTTGKRIDYRELSQVLEDKIRAKYESRSATARRRQVRMHVIGFAKLVGELIDGLMQGDDVLRRRGADRHRDHLRLHALRAQHRAGGRLLAGRGGLAARPGRAASASSSTRISILVPFLVFAIGVSHGAQKMNGIMQDIGRGTHKLVAARYTFRRLFLAGLTALLADAVGFAVLMVIDIPVIQDLALTASIGVAVLIFTNLLLLPVLLSYIGVSARRRRSAACSRGARGDARPRLRPACGRCSTASPTRRWAIGAIASSAVLLARRLRWSARNLKIGDLDPGAPELRADSRYNRDNAYITEQLRAVQRPVRGDRQDRARKAA